jgi:hypothetical protein
MVPYDTHEDSLYALKKIRQCSRSHGHCQHLPVFTLFHGVINKQLWTMCLRLTKLPLPFLTNNFHILQYCAYTRRNWEVLCVFYKCFLYQIHTNVVWDFSRSLPPLDPHVNGLYVVPCRICTFIYFSVQQQCQLNKLYFTSLSFNICSWVLLMITQTILSINAGTGDWKLLAVTGYSHFLRLMVTVNYIQSVVINAQFWKYSWNINIPPTF